MPEEKVIDIRTRKLRSDNPNAWAMIEQLIATIGAKQIVHMMVDMSRDLPELQLLESTSNTPQISHRVEEILYQAVVQLERFEASIVRKT